MCNLFFFSSRRRHTRCSRDWSSDVCSSDLCSDEAMPDSWAMRRNSSSCKGTAGTTILIAGSAFRTKDRKSTRLNSSHGYISYAVFCLKKKKKKSNIVTIADYKIKYVSQYLSL